MIAVVLQKLEDLRINLSRVDPGNESDVAGSVDAMVASLRAIMDLAGASSAANMTRVVVNPEARVRRAVN